MASLPRPGVFAYWGGDPSKAGLKCLGRSDGWIKPFSESQTVSEALSQCMLLSTPYRAYADPFTINTGTDTRPCSDCGVNVCDVSLILLLDVEYALLTQIALSLSLLLRLGTGDRSRWRSAFRATCPKRAATCTDCTRKRCSDNHRGRSSIQCLPQERPTSVL